ncbi:hypothetical protein [Deinococcus roseus]|uniref:CHRD domain-containing protein n=1 Tax=Deinococcus roseus TaxID=392414 RepID=A0ABQ2D1L6_9DEIO|nr:hypothetical protein [Deinococcus roseus]GGJ37521.1 hypothetical protein GCM10008938_24570 [Deinococcus roseus]
MKKLLILAATLGSMALASDMMGRMTVMTIPLMGMGMQMGSAVVVAWPSGEHEVFVHLEGLTPGSGMYANHIHFNATNDAMCSMQNGDKIIGLNNLMADDRGMATSYTKLPATVKFTMTPMYLNIHSNNPDAVGPSIICGDF